MRIRKAAVVLVLGLLSFYANTAMGQTATTGQISGVIVDPQGAAVAGARITIVSDAGLHRDTTSDAAGHYAFPLLPPGMYRLEAERGGFTKAVAVGVVVLITETTALEVRLQLAAKTTAIEVSAAPPLVDTENAARGTVIEEQPIRQLPLPTRNFQQLLTLTTGTSGPVQNSSELGRGAAPIYVDGNRATSNSVIINGTDANSIGTGSTPNLAVPATDTLEEFIVQTSQYDASQGRVAGGVVAAVTKSGTNDFHGDLYEFFRNDVLNANNFFLNAAGVPRPPYKRNQFGGVFGGPLKKDKLWFFISYQGSREVNGTSLLNSVGTVFVPADLSNDRSEATLDALAQSYGVAACATLAANCLQTFNPTADFLLKAQFPNGQYVIPSAPHPVPNPGPNLGPTLGVAAAPVVGISRFHEDQFNTNLDYAVTSQNRLSAKFFAANNPAFQALFDLFGLANPLPVPGFGGTANLNQRVFALDDTHAFSAHLVNDARFGFGFISTGSKPQEPFTAAQLGITSPLGNLFTGMPEIEVANYFDLGANPFSDNAGIERTYSAGDTLSWQKGKHSLKFGIEYKHHSLDETFNLYTRGQIIYAGLLPSGLAPNPMATDPFEAFLGGGAYGVGGAPLTDLTIMGSGVNNRDVMAWDLGGFVNDDWKLMNRLTVTLGLRYDYFGPFTEADGRFVGFDPSRLTTAAIPGFPAGDNTAITGGFVQAGNATNPLPGVPNVRDSLVPPDFKDFAPRFGFAWQPLASSNRFVVRGGYGIYYDRANSRLLNNQLLNFPYYTLAQAYFTPVSAPFAEVPQPSAFPLKFNNGMVFPFPGIAGPPALFLQAPSVYNPTGLDLVSANGIYPDIHNFRTPYVEQYSFGVQDEFAHNWLLDVSYVGSVGRREYRLIDLNQEYGTTSPLAGPVSPGLSSLVVQGFGVHLMQSSSSSSYNSLQVTVRKQLTHGLQFLAAYTYSHSLDDYSGDPTGTSDVTVVPGNEAVLNNYASSDFDRRQRLVLSGIYELPKFYKGDSPFARQLVNGWEVTTVIVGQTGTPFSVLTNATAFVEARADLVPGCNPKLSGSVNSRLNGYFNTSCFTPATALGDFGTSGRNILRGPAQQNVDISLIKFFPVTERIKVEFRSEFFNAFNTVSFENPINIVESPVIIVHGLATTTDGHIVATTTGPRVIQFALKLTF